ncbi:MAG: TPM domain-containing protein [bacterium]
MRDLTTSFLNEKEKNRIISCIKEVEKVTSGEIVPMIVSSSHHYSSADVFGGMALSLFISILATVIMGTENMWTFLAIFCVLFIILHEIVKRIPFLKRLFISSHEIEHEVKEEAYKSFFKKGIYKTRDHTGILIFISVFEKKVWVLADTGINNKVGPGVWNDIITIIINGIKEGKQGEAICSAIKKCSEILKDHFPVRSDDIDELDNLIIEKS